MALIADVERGRLTVNTFLVASTRRPLSARPRALLRDMTVM